MAEPRGAVSAPPARTIDTTVLIFGMVVLAAVLTWIVPAGAFAKEVIDVPGVGQRQVVVPGSFSFLGESSPQGLMAILTAPIRGFIEAADVIGFVLIVGGAFGVLQRTGAIEGGLRRLAEAAERSPALRAAVIPVFMTLFSLGGAVFGMAEETIPFVLIFVPLALSLGYDEIVGIAIPFVGSQAGFAAAFLNPFTIGVAQGIAEVPPASGFAYRLGLWVVTTSIAIGFVMWYAARVKARREGEAPEAAEPATGEAAASREAGAAGSPGAFGSREKAVLWAFGIGLVALVLGVTRYGWYINEIAGLFLAIGIAVGLLGGLGLPGTSGGFVQGARDLVAVAVIIGIARGILVVLQDGQVIDTILYWTAGLVDGVGPVLTAEAMYAVQTALNFFVPSGSGQAALTMPIMAPLADLVGVTRQTAVLAYQLGDGFTNMIIPTNPVLIGAITMGGVSWERWARWVLPLQMLLFLLGALALVPPVLTGWTG
ncbi:MAG TPA: TIGR00366 family protein [Longimicrobiales bacterium]|nr:TIGR00366 family protein [Longimicrobiales bacterium]